MVLFLAALPQSPAPSLVFVSNELARTITVIDAATRRPTSQIPVPGRPRGIAVSSDGRTLFVALSDTLRMRAGPADGAVRKQAMPLLEVLDGFDQHATINRGSSCGCSISWKIA